MFARFRLRSYELENIDKGTYTAAEYDGSLVEMRRVNRFLGDARALRGTLLREIECSGLRSFSVLDVGAGSGYLLRVIAKWASRTGRCARLVGVEINARSARAILEESQQFPEIRSIRTNALRLPFGDEAFDYAISTLALHHFDDREIVSVLGELRRVARRSIVVIDLHRHPLAYLLYTTAGRIVLRNRLVLEDGALSILRSFTPDELRQLGRRADLTGLKVERRFPYRLVLRARRNGFGSKDASS